MGEPASETAVLEALSSPQLAIMNAGSKRTRLPTAATIALDQAVNSASNFIAVAIVAHTLGLEAFGVFSTAQVITLVLQLASQAGTSDQLLATPLSDATKRMLIARSIRDRCAVLIMVTLVALGMAELFTQFDVDLILSILGYVCVLIFTDFVRNLWYAYRRAGIALVLDLLLAGLEVISLLIWHSQRHTSAANAWQALAMPYLVVALVGLVLANQLLGGVFTARTVSAFRWRYAAEVGGTLGILQLAQLVFIGVVGVSFAGQYRAVQLLLGPALLVIGSARPILIFVYARRSDISAHVFVTSALTMACLLWGLLCLGLPTGVRVLALGKEADIPRSLLIATIVLAMAQAVLTTTFYRARALANDAWTTRSRVVQTGVVVVVTVAACALRNPEVLILGFAAAAMAPIVLVRQTNSSRIGGVLERFGL